MKHNSLESFLDACGSREPLCLDVVQTDASGPRRQVLHQPFALVGRHERADVCLPGHDVSRRHALLQVIAGHTFCLDLGSRTGTHWEGGRDRGWLAGKAAVCVGPYRLSVAQNGGETLAMPPNEWDPLARGSLSHYALPAVTLHIQNHGCTVLRWTMNRVLVLIGSAEACKVRLRGPGVSKYHCALVSTPPGIWAIDLQRRGGVEINGTRLSHALLEDGDRVQVGGFTIGVATQVAGCAYPPVTTPTRITDASSRVAHSQLPAGVPGFDNAFGVSSAADLSVEMPWLVACNPPGQTWSPELVAGLLRQFGEMQQQFFEQSLTTMFQMFRTMHTEQVGTLRAEMARMEELNRELQLLVVERRRLGSVPVAPLLPPRTSERSDATPLSTPSAPSVPESGPLVTSDECAPADTAVPVHAQPTSQFESGTSEDVHLWLCQRMEAIQQERQGLWERIVGLLRKHD